MRIDFEMAQQTIQEQTRKGSILDVGCYNGQFLSGLKGNYSKYGIEISNSARSICEKKGIDIIGENAMEIKDERRFEVVTAFDLLEHVINPLEYIIVLTRLTKKKGYILLSTANSMALPWRLSRSEYWYYFPDHVSFISPAWLKRTKKLQKGLFEIEEVRIFSRFPGRENERYRDFRKLVIYQLNSLVKKVIRKSLSPYSAAPHTVSWRDHMYVVLRVL